MNIVGVSRYHNSAMAILSNGELVFHLENERLSNIKYDHYPFLLLNCLKDLVEDIDYLALAGCTKTLNMEVFTEYDAYTTFVLRSHKKFYDRGVNVVDIWNQHHKLHAAHAFYNSGFDKALCIVRDGMGSEFFIDDIRFKSNTFGREIGSSFIAEYPDKFETVEKDVMVGFDCDIKIQGNINLHNHPSEALAFAKISELFGFHDLDAGKVMGMAAYGVPDDDVPPIVIDGRINKELLIINNNDLRNIKFNSQLFPQFGNGDFQKDANLAYALQKECQEKVKNDILRLVEKTGCTNVCLSGGFFLNCVANYFYLRDLPKEIKIYIEPISGDAGTSIGAAKLLWHSVNQDYTKRPQTNIYYGFERTYTLEEIQKKLLSNETILTVSSDDVAELISKQNIVCIFQGRSEAGPRALGNRSILYDPRDPLGKDKVNKIKKREWFRPFAASILKEEATNWFEMLSLEESPFMMYAVEVKESKKEVIPSILHEDNTCRIQTVSEKDNLNYRKLIESFFKITGIPMVFNTSFNLAGDCIVETIDDALSTIRNSELKYLYLPELEILIEKNDLQE